MDKTELNKKLRILATRVKGAEPTILEQVRLELRAQTKETPTKPKLRKALAESLEVPESVVLVKLASHEDSERLLDDIINYLDKENE